MLKIRLVLRHEQISELLLHQKEAALKGGVSGIDIKPADGANGRLIRLIGCRRENHAAAECTVYRGRGRTALVNRSVEFAFLCRHGQAEQRAPRRLTAIGTRSVSLIWVKNAFIE